MNAAYPGEFATAKMNFKIPNTNTPAPMNPSSLSAENEPMFMFDIAPDIERIPTTIRAIVSRPAITPKKAPLPPHMLAPPPQTLPPPTGLRSTQIPRCQDRKLSIRRRIAPPASSLSAVDIREMSKPDEPEPSMHRSFQLPRDLRGRPVHRLSKRDPSPESNILPGMGSGRQTGDPTGGGDRSGCERRPRPPRGRLERRRERDRQDRRGRDDDGEGCHGHGVGSSAPPSEPPRGRDQEDRRDRRDHRPADVRHPGSEQAIAGAGPRPRSGGGEPRDDGARDCDRRSRQPAVGLRRLRQ